MDCDHKQTLHFQQLESPFHVGKTLSYIIHQENTSHTGSTHLHRKNQGI